MNAHALLTSQGWLGTGHALDSRLTDYGAPTYKQKGHRGLAYDPSQKEQATTGNGLIKPLLISQRHDSKRGIGKKAHEPQSGNEWWLKGFQSALENMGKSESERTTANNSGTSTPRHVTGYDGKHGGLYGYFVRGQLMKGTLEEGMVGGRPSKKRKSDVLDEDEDGSKKEKDPLAVLPVKRPQSAKELETSIPYFEERDKGRSPAHKRAQSTDVEQFSIISQFLGAVEGVAKNGKKKKRNSDELKQAVEAEADMSSDQPRQETKEERRARRRRRKVEKENRKLTLAEMVEEEMARLSSMNNTSDQNSEDADEKGRRKAERRRRKKEVEVKLVGN